MKYLTLFCTSALLLSVLPLSAQDSDARQTAAAKVFADRKDGTVSLSITRKTGNDDQTFEATALSLDGKGLLVTSLSSIEGGSSVAAIMAMQMGGGGGPDGANSDKGELTRVAMLRADATEAEADLILTDVALDLALIRVRPVEGAAMPPARIAAKTAPALLDSLVAIDRQGAEFQRVATTSMTEVAALLTTPRTIYLSSQPLPGGVAVYNLAGEWLGLASMMHDQSVIVPAAAILKFAEGASTKPLETKAGS
jgi:S1-C subfamily serine protease